MFDIKENETAEESSLSYSSTPTIPDKIHWNMGEIYKFYDFNPPPTHSQCWNQVIYEISMFVPFILAGIVTFT